MPTQWVHLVLKRTYTGLNGLAQINISFSVRCAPNYTGDNCESIIDHCVGINCSGNGQCQNSVDGYSCECDLDYTGKFCDFRIDNCFGITECLNGECVDGINTFTCSCDPDYTGDFCDIVICEFDKYIECRIPSILYTLGISHYRSIPIS